MEKINLINPGFISVKEVKDLLDENFVLRKYQRPVGYAANTRVHAGRLCIPVLNDSGATCSCLTEEQMIIIANHTMRMVEEGKMSVDDYNYPIVQLYRYENTAELRSREDGSDEG